MVASFPQAECVHVVTLNTHMQDRDGEHQQGAEQINDAIRELPERHPNVSIIEWSELVDDDLADHPPIGTLTPDTVHPGPEGEQGAARGLRRHVAALRTPVAGVVSGLHPSTLASPRPHRRRNLHPRTRLRRIH